MSQTVLTRTFHIYHSNPPLSLHRGTPRDALREAARLSRSKEFAGCAILVATHEVYGPGHTGGRTVCFVQDGVSFGAGRRRNVSPRKGVYNPSPIG